MSWLPAALVVETMLGDERPALRPVIVHLCGGDERGITISDTMTSDRLLVKKATLGVYAIDRPRWRRPFASRACDSASVAEDVDATRAVAAWRTC
jgi:hypothetical protein